MVGLRTVVRAGALVVHFEEGKQLEEVEVEQ